MLWAYEGGCASASDWWCRKRWISAAERPSWVSGIEVGRGMSEFGGERGGGGHCAVWRVRGDGEEGRVRGGRGG